MIIAASIMAAPPSIRRRVWLEWRRTGIGASDVAAILGISPHASAMSIWAEKHHGISNSNENEKMLYGRYAERMLCAWFNDHRAPLHCTNLQMLAHHSQDAMHHLASCDGMAFEHEPDMIHEIGGEWYADPMHAVAVIEMKSEGISNAWPEGLPPDHYLAQAQWQMHVTGQSACIFVVVHGWRFETYTIERNQADIDLMVEAVDRFWFDHVVTGRAPYKMIDGSDATQRTMRALFPTDEPDDDGEPVEAEIDADEYKAMIEARDRAEFWTERANTAKARIEAQLGTASFGTIDGVRVVSWKASRPTDIDPRALGAERVRNYAAIPERARRAPRARTFRVLTTNEGDAHGQGQP
jgi:putative phage-type endonuclease